MRFQWTRSTPAAGLVLALGIGLALLASPARAGEVPSVEDINAYITRAPAGSNPFLDSTMGNGWDMFDQFTYHGEVEAAIGSIDIMLLDPDDLIDPLTQMPYGDVEPGDDLQAVLNAAIALYGGDGFLNWGIRGWENADPSDRAWELAAFPNLPGSPGLSLASPIFLVPGESDTFLLNTVAYNEITAALSPMSEATGELIVGWRFNVVTVPEPHTAALLGVGLLALSLRPRRRAR